MSHTSLIDKSGINLTYKELSLWDWTALIRSSCSAVSDTVLFLSQFVSSRLLLSALCVSAHFVFLTRAVCFRFPHLILPIGPHWTMSQHPEAVRTCKRRAKETAALYGCAATLTELSNVAELWEVIRRPPRLLCFPPIPSRNGGRRSPHFSLCRHLWHGTIRFVNGATPCS